MATKAQIAKANKLQAEVNAKIKALAPQVTAVQKKVDPLGYAVTQAQQTYDKAKAGTSGTAINNALQGLSAAKTSLAQDRATKPELDALSIARGDTTQWNPKTQQYQIIKGPKEVTQNFNMNTKQWEFGTGGTGGTGGSTGGGTGGGVDNSLTKQLLAQQQAADTQAAMDKQRARQSAIEVLTARFKQYGLESLASTIQRLAVDGATEATITLGLMETDEYKQRFKANSVRVKNGTSVLSPADYLNLEDTYRQVLRAYGLTQFDTDAYVSQFIGNDMSATELSNRVVTAVQRVQNADPAILQQLTAYYGIGSKDLVAYVLDPSQQFQKIERQVAAGEIGVAAARQGLTAGVTVAEQLASQGITQAEAQKGYSTIADILPTANKLGEIYGGQMDKYGQAEAEQEVFNGLASAQRKRQKLSETEIGTFGSSSGVSKNSFSSSKQGSI
jgi:hypothetical protein